MVFSTRVGVAVGAVPVGTGASPVGPDDRGDALLVVGGIDVGAPSPVEGEQPAIRHPHIVGGRRTRRAGVGDRGGPEPGVHQAGVAGADAQVLAEAVVVLVGPVDGGGLVVGVVGDGRAGSPSLLPARSRAITVFDPGALVGQVNTGLVPVSGPFQQTWPAWSYPYRVVVFRPSWRPSCRVVIGVGKRLYAETAVVVSCLRLLSDPCMPMPMSYAPEPHPLPRRGSDVRALRMRYEVR